MINIPYKNSRLEDLEKGQENFYKEALKKHYFHNENTKGLFLEKEEKFLKNIVEGKKSISDSILGFQRSSHIYMQYLQYLFSTRNNEIDKKNILAISNTYNTFFISFITSKDCLQYVPIPQENLSYSLALLILSDVSHTQHIMKYIISNIENKNNIIYNDEKIIQAPLWFLLSFYAKIHNNDFILSTLEVESVSYPYTDILQAWDNEDMTKIELWIYLLCEVHIELTRKDEYYHNILSQLFPYEILTWLKLREHAGLKNPKTFTHPLMNTPIAKMFLNIKEPLPKPKELPYAKDLLEKLKEQCPNVEIPEWLDSEDTPNTSTEIETNTQSSDTIPDDFMK